LPVEDINKYDGMMTKECRKYLIGKSCEWANKNRTGDERVSDVYKRLGEGFGYTGGGIKNVVTYARAIDHFYVSAPDIASAILSGNSRLNYRNVHVLAKLKLPEARKIMKKLAHKDASAKIIFSEQKVQMKKNEKRNKPKTNSPAPVQISIKDTPPHDPDSQITSLTFTIPSWVGAIDRAFTNTDFHQVSQAARSKLVNELVRLKEISGEMIEILSFK
jgi:hypothetical protein